MGLFARWLSTDGNEDLATLSMLVGALTLARATAGSDLSERILAAAHEALPGVAAPGRRHLARKTESTRSTKGARRITWWAPFVPLRPMMTAPATPLATFR